MTFELFHSECLEKLKTLEDNSIDSIVTDPPYGLSFMGRKWDYDVPSVEIWCECLRVLKPGGHLLAFAGTRTQHRMCVNIEDAGFEIRDMIAWVYGSGFPKSMNVSKAIDKAAPRRGQFDAFAKHFAERLQASGKSQKEVAALFPSKSGGLTGCVWNWANGANVPTKKQFEILKPLLGLSDEFAVLIDRVEAEREVIGKSAWSASAAHFVPGEDHTKRVILDITAPATPEAQQWEGWGTALKPALEPITVARKPLGGTVAENVLRHGTGAINVDGCRVGTEQRFNTPASPTSASRRSRVEAGYRSDEGIGPGSKGSFVTGRWPANLIHDGSDEVVQLFPETKSGARKAGTYGVAAGKGRYGEYGIGEMPEIEASKGSAARFFYCAKASKKDRGEGNSHPTVKPVELMRYLCRLVTPPGGVVLDPFMGSGSTGKAAMLEGFNFIGIEMDEEYVNISKMRIEAAAKETE